MAKIFYDVDADLSFLKGKKVAVIGYGSQGHSQAQNLKDSGVDVVVGLRKGSASWEKAEKAGLKVVTPSEAAKMADVIQILINDEKQAELYRNEILPGLEAGNALAFSHGFNIHYAQIQPPKDVDVFMVAPKGPGHLVRRLYNEGTGIPGLVAVHQDATGKAMQIALAYAKGIGCTRAGTLLTTFKEETETDLFGEQSVLCGGVTAMIQAGFDTLVEAGYQPEIAYFECLHELKLIVDLIYAGGITRMRDDVSNTAEYGDLKSGKRIITQETRKEMKKILAEIQDGTFAKDWLLENQVGRPFFNAMRDKESNFLIEKVGKEIRAMIPWIDEE